MKEVKIQVNTYKHREAMIIALTHAGFNVKVKEEPIRNECSSNFYVVFQCPDNCVKQLTINNQNAEKKAVNYLWL